MSDHIRTSKDMLKYLVDNGYLEYEMTNQCKSILAKEGDNVFEREFWKYIMPLNRVWKRMFDKELEISKNVECGYDIDYQLIIRPSGNGSYCLMEIPPYNHENPSDPYLIMTANMPELMYAIFNYFIADQFSDMLRGEIQADEYDSMMEGI